MTRLLAGVFSQYHIVVCLLLCYAVVADMDILKKEHLNQYCMKPKFNKKFPKNKWTYYFNPQSDEAFKSAHPFAYYVIVIIGIMVFLAPGYVYFIITELCFKKDTGSAWTLLGVIGSAIFGIGLFNIVAAFLKQYLGHLFTIVCLLLGFGMMALSIVLM